MAVLLQSLRNPQTDKYGSGRGNKAQEASP